MSTPTEPPTDLLTETQGDPTSDRSTPSTPSTGSPSTTPASTTSDPRPERIRLVAALVAVGAAALFFVATVAIVQGDDDDEGDPAAASAETGWGGIPVERPIARPDFTLTGSDGQPYDFGAETEGRLTMLFFGYTNCPDVCPLQMATLATALDSPGMPEPTVVFVTTDPARDTPEHLRGWLDQFGFRDVVGLTGTIEEIAAAEGAAHVAGSMLEPGASPGESDYEVGHAAQILAYTPDDLAHVVYPSGVRSEDWIADLPRLLDTYGAGS